VCLVLRIQTKENPFEGCALVKNQSTYPFSPSLFVYVKQGTMASQGVCEAKLRIEKRSMRTKNNGLLKFSIKDTPCIDNSHVCAERMKKIRNPLKR